MGLLVLLARSENLRLVVGHVDHGLRADSADEAGQVAALAAGLGLRFESTRLELEPGPGLPARAREARRRALIEQAERCAVPHVVLAHTATDQAETLLMHAARGCGLEGLSAMPIVDGPWVRPLLDRTRAELRAIAQLLELPIVDDPTNADRDQLRAWLRHEVLAPLRSRNPELDRALAGLAADARDAESALDGWAQRELDARSNGQGWSLVDFHALPRAVRTRVVRRICLVGGADRSELRRRVIAEIESAATAISLAEGAGPGTPRPAPKYWQLHPRRSLCIDKNGVRVSADPPFAASEQL